MDKTFVRKAFYRDPPKKDATVADWLSWRKADEKAAHHAQQRFNRAHKIAQSIESTPSMSSSKVEGVHKQLPSIGFVGSVESPNTVEQPTGLEPRQSQPRAVQPVRHAQKFTIKRKG